jgi:hypothetical protein
MRATGIPTAVLALVLLAFQSGCYNVYQPVASPRIQLRSDNVLLKDGKVVTSLKDAVRENPAAEAEAERSSRASSTANLLNIAGLGTGLTAAITGFALTGTSKTAPPAAIATFIAGGSVWLVTSIAGMGYFVKASRHATNAINMYNDGLPPCPPPAR